MEMAEEMMNASPELAWMADDLTSPKNPSEPPWSPDEQDQKPGLGSADQAEAREELAEKIKTLMPGGSALDSKEGMKDITDWADKEKKRSPGHWTNRLMKLASNAADSAAIEGSSDLTYSKRNPNQQQIGPILMGMLDYSPTIYTLNDQSYSMVQNAGLLRAAQTYLDLTKAMFSRYGDTSLWIGVDTEVRYVGKPKSPRTIHRSELPMLFAMGGTDFEDVIEDLVSGKFRYEGKRYKKPDLLVINTDCKFEWPWPELRRPPRGTKILVCSVIPLEKARNWLPPWIGPQHNNFIEVDPR